MPDNNPPPNEPPRKLKRVSRTASFWVLLALMSVLAFQFMRGGEQTAGEISQSEFQRQLANNNILEVTFFGEAEVRGEFKNTIVLDEGEKPLSLQLTQLQMEYRGLSELGESFKATSLFI